MRTQLARAMRAMKGAYKPGGGGGRCHETIARAYAGLTAAEKGRAMRDMHWEALRQFACGCLAPWEPVDWKRGKAVQGEVHEAVERVQCEMNEMVQAWRVRAAGGIEWERERGDKAEWMRLIVRAWRGGVRGASDGQW